MKKAIGFLCLFLFIYQGISSAEEYTLKDIFSLALQRSEQIRISEEEFRISEAGKDKASSFLIPKLSLFGELRRYKEGKVIPGGQILQPETSSLWGIRLDQSISIGGNEFISLGISKDNIEKNRYEIYRIKEEYLYGVAVQYYNVLSAERALEIGQSNVARLKSHRDAAALRLKVGEVTKTVLLRAEAELEGAYSDLVRMQNNLAIAKVTLIRLVGVNEDFTLKESEDELAETLSIEALKEIAYAERPELRGIMIQNEIAKKQVRYSRGFFLPTVSVEAVFTQRDDEPESDLFMEESFYGGIKLSFPFFEGGLRKAELRESLSRLRQAELAISDIKKTIEVEVQSAYLDVIANQAVIEKLDAQLNYAKENYGAVSKQFDYGLATSLDVMDANNLLTTTEKQLSDEKATYRLSLLRLKKATGTLVKSVLGENKGGIQ
ncbi:MAG: TolC family protein [Nitrospirae bacterium]|nr:TolC family protein [Nitrospirota bacterium]